MTIVGDGRSATLLLPASLDTRTGGYIYNRRIVDGLLERGWAVSVRQLGEGYPHPDDEARARAAARVAGIDDDEIVIVDSLAFGPLAPLWREQTARLRLVALMHLPLSASPDLSADARERMRVPEVEALAAARRTIVTGPRAIPLVEGLGVPRARIAVVMPGTDRRAGLTPYRASGPARLLCVAAVTEAKGHLDLVEALAPLTTLPWTLTFAGSVERDPDFVRRLRERIEARKVTERVTFAGELGTEALDREYRLASIAVLPSRGETFGMAAAEAMAYHLPVVATRTGSVPDIVGDAGALVEPGDVRGLQQALATVIADAALRQRCAIHAQASAARLHDWDVAVNAFAAVLEDVRHG